jgi:hypothetical protein
VAKRERWGLAVPGGSRSGVKAVDAFRAAVGWVEWLLGP